MVSHNKNLKRSPGVPAIPLAGDLLTHLPPALFSHAPDFLFFRQTSFTAIH